MNASKKKFLEERWRELTIFWFKREHSTVVKHSTRKGEIDYFVPYEGLNWF